VGRASHHYGQSVHHLWGLSLRKIYLGEPAARKVQSQLDFGRCDRQQHDAFPDLGISHHGDLQDIGNRFPDYIKFMLWHYGYAGCGYVLDTTYLYPRHIIGMREKIGNVPALFLGYTRADPGQKLRQIRSFDPGYWWTSELSDAVLKQLIHNQITKSIELKEACGQLGIPFVDVGHHFEESLDRAEAILNTK
jgi:hypothetical protein